MWRDLASTLLDWPPRLEYHDHSTARSAMTRGRLDCIIAMTLRRWAGRVGHHLGACSRRECDEVVGTRDL